MNSPVRRVVTGHDGHGNAIIVSDGAPAAVFPLQALPGLVFSEIWRTVGMPVPIDNGGDPTVGPLRLAPNRSGSVIRVVDMPPDPDHATFKADELFSEIAAASASTSTGKPADTLMHRTETVDYGIVIEGEIWLVVDEGETLLKPGDIVVQRGTNHAWSNRSDRNARMVFILLDGRFAPELTPLT
ncbi:cupin 2 domain-containing protein [Burkholderia lata]|uniref:Cupin 2 domain-containing protein n=1 Tax=Burkholderia lata (strain ATCC 17760 / DSM 23089 / LMG 22485 / NCIMB 9086 / R18194 / 383) TaxID=482957 RepID=A0A6P2WCI0_BURL3|nr:cupin domain-containing protein [Burkholderia lata]VWC89357.1 cupin 2 domain-containing protein [Burkholderia lata]